MMKTGKTSEKSPDLIETFKKALEKIKYICEFKLSAQYITR